MKKILLISILMFILNIFYIGFVEAINLGTIGGLFKYIPSNSPGWSYNSGGVSTYKGYRLDGRNIITNFGGNDLVTTGAIMVGSGKITGKITSSFTSINDGSGTLTTKNYVDNKIPDIMVCTGTGFLQWDGSNWQCKEMGMLPINGTCGPDNSKDLINMPTNLCSNGNSSGLLDNGPGQKYTWSCLGKNGGIDSILCSANNINPIPINGTCGSSDNTASYSTPTQLCSNGSSSTVINNGPGSNYTWTCSGANGGNNINCSSSNMSKYSVLDCGTTSGQILYGSNDGLPDSLACWNDITICNGTTGSGYTISACNAGAGIAYTGQVFPSFYGPSVVFGSDAWSTPTRTYATNNWAGGLYQWGNITDVSYTSTGSGPITIIYTGGPIGSTQISNNTFEISPITPDLVLYTLGGTLVVPPMTNNFDWVYPGNKDYWGDITDTNTARKGPCYAGYHVPTYSEWNGLSSLGSNLVPLLKLPLAGSRNGVNGSISGQKDGLPYNWRQLPYGSYWTSSTYGNYSISIGIDDLNIYTAYMHTEPRGNGLSVRCFKN